MRAPTVVCDKQWVIVQVNRCHVICHLVEICNSLIESMPRGCVIGRLVEGLVTAPIQGTSIGLRFNNTLPSIASI